MSGNPMIAVADHVLGLIDAPLPASTIAKARTFLLDTLGVGIAGTSGAQTAELLEVVAGWGQGDEATAWGSGRRLPAGSAAVVNAYHIHCLEYDCVHEGAVVHPMATILSAAFAWAERSAARGKPVPGERFVRAMVAGVDVAALLGMAATGPIKFFRPATAGGFGAVAALAVLAGFDRRTLLDAWGNQYGQTSGTLQPHVEGSPVLGLQIGFNARAAIASCDLAAAGFRGPHDVLTGPYGYLRLIEQEKFDLDRHLAALGVPHQIERLAHKPFPSGRLTHGVVEALQRVVEGERIAPGRITAIRALVPPLVHRLVGRPDIAEPEPNYAKLCLAFVAGTYLAHGVVDVPQFRGTAMLHDPRTHAFAAKVEVIRDANPDENALDPQRFEIATDDGHVRTIDLDHVFGHPDSPLTDAQNRDKFRRCWSFAAQAHGNEARDRIEAMVDDILQLADVADLVKLLVPRP